MTKEEWHAQIDSNCPIKMPIYINHVQFYIGFVAIGATMISIFINIAWMFVYYIEHPLINQYKMLKDEPWPWHTDP
jgi:hypothetical protein